MKLELNESEVKAILLAHMAKQFPGAFNDIELDTSYNRLRSVTFSKMDPEPEPLTPPPGSIIDTTA